MLDKIIGDILHIGGLVVIAMLPMVGPAVISSAVGFTLNEHTKINGVDNPNTLRLCFSGSFVVFLALQIGVYVKLFGYL